MKKFNEENAVLKLAQKQEKFLLVLIERLEKRNMKFSDSLTYQFERAKMIGILDALDALRIDRKKFDWIF